MKEKEHLIGKMVIKNMKENGIIISIMDREHYIGKMKKINLDARGNGKMEYFKMNLIIHFFKN